ncbi:MAG TPA: arginine--tRNA ligase [Dermatophilaceae bacterium]|jgi:arginyl-tRNA synthetase|nr:arginine--tRNA ligase [Dermatophilaceae bacterium]
MPSPHDTLAPRITAAIAAAFGEDFRDADPVLRPSQFADLQVNAALALGKRVGMPPRQVAERIVEHLDATDLCETVEISGPGFLNVTLADSWIAAAVQDMAGDPRLGVGVEAQQVIPLDYSSPNVAKEMHVGHLRTTVVGDALARTLEHLGHKVIRQNHIGDWGTPFAMLIEHFLDVGADSPEAQLIETDPNAFYSAAREKFDTSGDFADRARARVVALQAGDPETLALWRRYIDLTLVYLHTIYDTLGVTLTDDDLAGESSYNDDLPRICDELEAAGIAVVSDGALCVFLDEFTGREGKPVPLIVRKSDGGFGYATTDLAMIRQCVREFRADRIVYVVGAPQALHFRMVWATARKAGWLPDDVEPIHVQIGNVLGTDKKILRTREGVALKLMDLLEEGVDKARAYVDEARPDLPETTRADIARQVGIGAIKYADLSVAHDTAYVFDLDRMVALTGNTGPYLQYAAARIRSIFRSAGLEADPIARAVQIVEPSERALALQLLEFGAVVRQVGEALEPHRLCGYLFELAQAFSAFYENCPVLKADGETRESRLALCALTAQVLVQGLDLLGVETPAEM